jgi:uncharacterized protein
MLKSIFRGLFSFEKIDMMKKNPDLELPSILELDISIIRRHNISKMIFDLDQTFAIQSTNNIPNGLLKQLEIFKTYLGVDNLCFLSNEISENRSMEIEKLTGVHVVRSQFKKPDKRAYEDALNYLNTSVSRNTAMVGDRLWTDILGANSIGLFTIKVRPLTPNKDKVGAAIFRKLEDTKEKYGFKRFLNLTIQLLTITGLGLVQLSFFIYDFFEKLGKLNVSGNIVPFMTIAFVLLANIYYWTIISFNSKSFHTVQNKNFITYAWSTYPLFFRYILSLTFWIYSLYAYYFVGNYSASMLFVADFFCFISHISLILSLFSFYHSNKWRIFRIIIDISIVFIIGYYLPINYLYYSILLLFIPVGTASKYYGWPISIIVNIICVVVVYSLCWVSFNHTIQENTLVHIFVFCGLFFVFSIVQKIDSREAANPIDNFIELLNKEGVKDIEILSLLKVFCTVMNCEGVYLINSETNGFYYLKNNNEEKGKINEISNMEIYNYLQYNKTNVISDPKTNTLEISQKQKRLLEDFNSQTVLQPPPLKGLQSVIISSMPFDSSHYLIFVNSTTHSGVTRKKFSISHLRTACICSIIISRIVSIS